MSWVLQTQFLLIGSNMCYGEKHFSPYIPNALQFGLDKGTYRISYVNGAIRSHNSQRFISFLPKLISITSNNSNNSSIIIGNYYLIGINTWSNYSDNSIKIVLENSYYLLYINNVKYISIQENQTTFEFNNELFNLNVKSSYLYKWNKFYDLQYNLESLKPYNFSYFPELKYAVFQCQYGTLPGFTPFGANTIELAEIYAKGLTIIELIKTLIKPYILPLTFTLLEKSSISFWYTDDCAPCVLGSITYKLEKYIDNSLITINSFGVLSYNINTLEILAPEYYKISNNNFITTSDEYIKQYNYIDINSKTNYIKNLYEFNTLGYYNNAADYKNNKNMNVSYVNNYLTKNYQDIYWEITKIKNTSSIDLISNVNTQTFSIPLFLGTYTIIPNKSEFLSGNLYLSESSTNFNNKNLLEYTFTLNNTTKISFTNCYCFLYNGVTTKKSILDFYNKDTNILKENIFNIQNNFENILIIKDINLINYDFYLYISNDNSFIQIVSNILQNLIDENIQNYLIGPFNTILLAQKEVDKYCVLNGLEYNKIDLNLFSIGINNA